MKKQLNYLMKKLNKIFSDKLISIVLFGSYAKQNYNKFSDLDLIVVVEKEIKENNTDILNLRKDYLINYKKELDLHIFSKKEIIENFNSCSPMFNTLLLGNKILFDRDNFFEDIFKNFIKRAVNIETKYYKGGKIWELNKTAKNLMNLH